MPINLLFLAYLELNQNEANANLRLQLPNNHASQSLKSTPKLQLSRIITPCDYSSSAEQDSFCKECLKLLFPQAKQEDIEALSNEITKIPVNERPYFLGNLNEESQGLTKAQESSDIIYRKDGVYYDRVKGRKGKIGLRARKSVDLTSSISVEKQKNVLSKETEIYENETRMQNASKKEHLRLVKENSILRKELNNDLNYLRKNHGIRPIYDHRKDVNGNSVVSSFDKSTEQPIYQTRISSFEADLNPETGKNSNNPREYISDKELNKFEHVKTSYLQQKSDQVRQSPTANPRPGEGFIQTTGDAEKSKFLKDYNREHSKDLPVSDLSQIGKVPKLKAASAVHFWLKHVSPTLRHADETNFGKISSRITNKGSTKKGPAIHEKERIETSQKAKQLIQNCPNHSQENVKLNLDNTRPNITQP